MQDPKKQPAGESGPRKGPPPGAAGPRKGPPPPRPGGPTGSGPQPRPGPRPPGKPTGATPPGGEVRTPRAPSDSAEELVFMSHAPGASVAPRQIAQIQQEVRDFEEKLKQKEEEKQRAEEEERRKAEERSRRAKERTRQVTRPAASTAQSTAGSFVEGAVRISEGAGMGALARAVHAARGESAAPERAPPFWPSLPGALLAPVRRASLSAVVSGVALLAVALLLIEVSPRVGLLALAVAGLELIALRVRWIRDAAGGKDDASWPAWSDVVGSLPLAAAATFVLAPAVALAMVAYGPGIWDARNPASVPARAARVWSPPTEADLEAEGGSDAPDTLGRHVLGMLDAVVGQGRPAATLDRRTSRELAKDVAAATHLRLDRLTTLEGLPATSLAWRGLLLVGLYLVPMALLAASRLKSAYAALYPPVLLRGVLRGPAAYLVALTTWVILQGAMLAAVLLLPALLHGKLDPFVAHLLWALVTSAIAVGGAVVHGAILGRFYRSHAQALGWE